MARRGVLRLLLALRLELVNPPLGFDHGRIDVRRDLLARTPFAVAIAAAAATPPAPLLVAVALRTRILGTRIAGVRTCNRVAGIRKRVLKRGLRLALGAHLRLLRRTGLLPLLLRARSLRPAVRARTAIRTAIVALPVTLSLRSLSVAWTSIPLRLAVSALLEATLLLSIAVLVTPAVASTTVASTISPTVASTVTPTVTSIPPMLRTLVALSLPLRLDRGHGSGRRRRLGLEQAAEQAAEESATRGRARERLRLRLRLRLR
jgi:hypothetical protein